MCRRSSRRSLIYIYRSHPLPPTVVCRTTAETCGRFSCRIICTPRCSATGPTTDFGKRAGRPGGTQASQRSVRAGVRAAGRCGCGGLSGVKSGHGAAQTWFRLHAARNWLGGKVPSRFGGGFGVEGRESVRRHRDIFTSGRAARRSPRVRPVRVPRM